MTYRIAGPGYPLVPPPPVRCAAKARPRDLPRDDGQLQLQLQSPRNSLREPPARYETCNARRLELTGGGPVRAMHEWWPARGGSGGGLVAMFRAAGPKEEGFVWRRVYRPLTGFAQNIHF